MKLHEYELENWRSLGDKNMAYIPSAVEARTRFASEIAIEGTRFCSDHIESTLEPVLAKKVTQSLEEAIELLTFIPDKIAGQKQ